LILDSPLTIPTPPAQIQAMEDTTSLKVLLNWPPGFGIDPAYGYRIQRKIGLPTSSAPYQTLIEVGPYTLSFEDLEVQPNVIYTYRIQTILWGGSGITVWSNEATAYVPNIVPVELQSFTAEVSDYDVKLVWSTATETNNSGFEILRSTQNDNAWENIGFVPGFGTTTEVHNYSFIDESIRSGNYQYRLKQIDFDGTFEYSSIIDVTVDAPTKFSLEQNYPNPFNPVTKIKYEIPGQARNDNTQVTLKVYDILGNEVATLVNEQKPAGTYEVEFNVAQVSRPELSSGIYFYQLKAGSFVETKKMVLLR
jgi:hypothetical protein